MFQPPQTLQFLRWLLSFLFISIASNALALQLGRPQIQSKLGEPLKLEVQINELEEMAKKYLSNVEMIKASPTIRKDAKDRLAEMADKMASFGF